MLLLLGLRWLPKRLEADRPATRTRRRALRRARDLVIARRRGAGLAALAYAMMTRPRDREHLAFFLEHAYPRAAAPTSST